MEQILDTETLQRRLQMSLLGAFAALALLLAGLGIYGVIVVRSGAADSGNRHPHCSWGRAAASAAHGNRRGHGPGAARRRIGCCRRLRVHAVASLLFGTAANNAFACGSVSGLLPGVALAACFIPARRASRVEPIVALALRVTRRYCRDSSGVPA